MGRTLVPNAVRVAGGLIAGVAASLLLQTGAPTSAAWAVLGGLLLAFLCGLERFGRGAASRAASGLGAGLALGALAGAGAWMLGGQVAALVEECAPALSFLATELSAFASLGLAAGTLPGFFSFSGALSRDGALGGLFGGAVAGVVALFAPAPLALVAGGIFIACGFVALRRSHAPARLVPLDSEDRAQQFITLRQHWVTLGSGPECDLQVSESAVQVISPLVLTFRDGTYWLEDPSGRKDHFKVNGEPARSKRLSEGDVIEVGRHRYRFELLDGVSRSRSRG